jgi:hypothetical protein
VANLRTNDSTVFLLGTDTIEMKMSIYKGGRYLNIVTAAVSEIVFKKKQLDSRSTEKL